MTARTNPWTAVVARAAYRPLYRAALTLDEDQVRALSPRRAALLGHALNLHVRRENPTLTPDAPLRRRLQLFHHLTTKDHP